MGDARKRRTLRGNINSADSKRKGDERNSKPFFFQGFTTDCAVRFDLPISPAMPSWLADGFFLRKPKTLISVSVQLIPQYKPQLLRLGLAVCG